jgi:hypothetical protein
VEKANLQVATFVVLADVKYTTVYVDVDASASNARVWF